MKNERPSPKPIESGAAAHFFATDLPRGDTPLHRLMRDAADNDIVSWYPQAILAGDVPGWHELQSRFPELADELHALRSAKGWLETSPNAPANEREPKAIAADTDDCRLSRWLVSFASGSGWYPVGEFIALNAAASVNPLEGGNA